MKLNHNYFRFKVNMSIIISIIAFIFITCDESFKSLICLYPTTFALYNGNNLLCCSNGIYTYDSNFEKEKYFYKFENEIESFSEANFVTISQYPDNGNVILITKNKLYFISPEGKVLFFNDLDIETKSYYYTLVPYKYKNNFNVVIGFINISGQINLLYYNIDVSLKNITLIIDYEPTIKIISGENGYNFFNGFTCQIMNSNNYNNDLLTCFYGLNTPGEIGAFSLYINSTIQIIEDLFSHIEMSEGKRYIKSAVSPDKSKALICFSCDNSYGYYLKYDINLLQFYYGPISYMTICGFFSNTIKVNYVSRTQEYIFFCHYQNDIKIAKFDKNMDIIQNEYLTQNIKKDYSLSTSNYGLNFCNVVFIEEYQNYAFLMDTNYLGNTTARLYIFPDSFIPDVILPISYHNSNFNSLIETTIIPTTLIKNISKAIITNIPSTLMTTISSIITTTIPKIIPSSLYSSLYKSNKFTISSTIHNNISTDVTPQISAIKSSIPISTISPNFTLPFLNSYIYSSLVSLKPNNISSYPSSSILPSFSPFSSYISKIFPIITQNNNKNNEKNEICQFEYFYKSIKTNECKKICSYNEFINEICYINNLTKNNIINITEHFRNLITKLEVNENTNIIINGHNVNYQIVSSEVIDENKNKNVTIIDFDKCEEKLKNLFDIDYILILQLDVFLSNSTNIVMKYEVYNPYTLERLDLSVCDDMTIDVYLPYSIPDEDLDLYIKLKELGYDLYNPNDSFYHDVCTPFTSNNKTDILLSDRRLDFYKNITFCEEGCTYKSYDYFYKKVECECKIKNEIDNNIDNIKFYGNLLISTFYKIETFTNIKVLKCFKLVFSALGQTKNIGSYIFIILNLIYIILMILFYKNGKNQLFNIINTIIRNKSIKTPIKKKTKISNKCKKRDFGSVHKIIINENIIINNHYTNSKKLNNNKNNNSDKNSYLLDLNYSKKKHNSISSSLILSNNGKKGTKIFNNNKKSKLKENKQINQYNDFELNSLPYEKAIIYDKRTYTQYYCSLLKEKHLILFTFISKNDYNLFIIKLSLFIFSFSLYFSVNTLFFDDNTIHKIYENQGKLEYIYNILNIIYSAIISSIITLILKLLALSNKSILQLKNNKKRKKILNESTILVKNLNIKFHIYYIMSFFILILFWYFISSFCVIYNNSQLLLIENTLSSFALSLIYPFGLYLLPGIFRIIALRSKNKKCIYSFGNLITNI